MKKIAKAVNRQCGPVRLYLDDVRSIVEVLQAAEDEVDDDIVIILKTEDYELQNVDELLEIGSRMINRISIHCEISNLYPQSLFDVSIWEHGCYIDARADTAFEEGIVTRIERILLARRRLRLIHEISNWYYGIPIGIGAIGLTLGFLSDQPSIGYIALTVMVALSSGIAILQVIGITYNKSQVVLADKPKKFAWLHTNKDQLILIIITAVVTAILSVIGTLIVERAR